MYTHTCLHNPLLKQQLVTLLHHIPPYYWLMWTKTSIFIFSKTGCGTTTFIVLKMEQCFSFQFQNSSTIQHIVPNIKPRAKINYQNFMSNVFIMSINTLGILDPCSQGKLMKPMPQHLLNRFRTPISKTKLNKVTRSTSNCICF